MTVQKFLILLTLVSTMGAGQASAQDLSDRFYQAIRNEDTASLKMLLKSEDVNTADSRGATPLMYAAAVGSADAMKLLLNAGADVNGKNSFDATALIWAGGDPVISRMLIEHGADINALSKQGRTPLMAAAHRDGASELVRWMLARGADPKVKSGRGNDALLVAAEAGDLETIHVLIDKGSDVNTANSFGETPLRSSVGSNRLDTVRYLLANGAKVDAAVTVTLKLHHGPVAVGNHSVLMAAAPYAPPDMIRTLLKAGADVKAKDIRGMTPLMLAVASETQNVEVVKILLAAGSDVNAVSTVGETPLDWAKKFGSRPVIAALLSAGARKGVSYTPPHAPERTNPLDAAKALGTAVPLLQRTSTEFFKESGCSGCHHTTTTALAARDARTVGVPVDEAAAREQLKTIKSQAISNQESMLQGLFEAGDVPLNLLEGLSASGYPADHITDSIVVGLASIQRADGSWGMGRGFSRAPIQEGDISRTARQTRALQVYGFPGRRTEFEGRIARARAWLLKARPATTDDWAMLLLGLKWSAGDMQKIQSSAQVLIAQQRTDGGWAGNPNLLSDAFATGEALHALHETGTLAAGDPVYQRGVRFLLNTQYSDGSWYVRSRAVKIQPYFQSGFPFEHDQWISAAETAWAVMALAPAVPQQ